MRFRLAAARIILSTVVLWSAGCRNEGNTGNVNSPPRPETAGAESNTNTATVNGQPARATTTPAAAPTTTTMPATGEAVSLPITDAVAFRDRLLELARGAKFDAQQSAANNGYAVREAWQKQYPGLKFTFFYTMTADANTVSASDAFLTTGAAVSGNYDRLYAFAVADMKGNCAGGAVVIPGDAPQRKVSDETVPTVFKPVEMASVKSCTGDAAGENYRP